MPPLFRLASIATLLVLVPNMTHAQLTPLDSTQYHSESPVYTDAQGTLYSTDVFARFGSFVVDTPPPTARVSDSHIRSGAVLAALNQIGADFGAFDLDKQYPDAAWGQNASTHLRTGAPVQLLDVSQIVRLRFVQPVLVDSVAAALDAMAETDWAEGPVVVQMLAEPDDPNSMDIETRPIAYPNSPSGGYPLPHYNEDRIQWALHRLNAVEAWELARAHEPVLADRLTIGLPEWWTSSVTLDEYGFDAAHPDFRFEPGVPQVRENLRLNVLSGWYGLQHGLKVASYASPISDNGIYHAGLAWDAMMRGYSFGLSGLAAAACVGTPLGCEPTDVINCSFASGDYQQLEIVVYNALAQGIVVVAGAVYANGAPQVVYPAAYHFPTTDYPNLSAQVIATTGADYQDEHPSSLGYAAGTDPTSNPRSAYIDVAASTGTTIKLFTLPSSGQPVYGASYDEDPATSWASPRIASLAALLLSVNDTLTPNQVHEAITETARKTGQYAYDAQTGWNQYLGYGLADAGKAVRYVLENFGGEIGGDPEGRPYRLRESLFVKNTATVTVLAGTELIVDETLIVDTGATFHLEPGATLRFDKDAALSVSGTLYADGAHLTGQGAQSGWEGLDVLKDGYAHLDGGTLLDRVVFGPASVYVAGGEVRISDGSEIIGMASGAPRGVYVTSSQPSGGSTLGEAVIELGAIVRSHDSDGVYVYNDGQAVIENSFVTLNGGAAVEAFGQGAVAYVSDSEITGNASALSASFSGTVSARPPQAFGAPGYPNLRATDQTATTLAATFGGSVIAGAGSRSPSRNNDFAPDLEDHARAFDGGAVTAEYNYWGSVTGPAPTRVLTSGLLGAGTFDGCPYLRSESPTDVGASCGGASSRSADGSTLRSGDDSEPSGPIQAAYRAMESGELDQAAALLATAVLAGDPVHGEATSTLAFAALPRLVRAAQDRHPQALGQALAMLEQHAAPDQPYRAEALRALIRVHLALGDLDGALAASGDLLVEAEAGRADQAGAFADRASVLVAADDLADADAALAVGEALTGSEAEELVRARYDLVARLDALGLEGGEIARAAERQAASRSTGPAFSLGAPYPNPARGATLTLPITLPVTAAVEAEVFDVLGRRVAKVRQVSFEAGERRLLVPVLGLSAGPYVVRAKAVTETGRTHVASARFVIAQ